MAQVVLDRLRRKFGDAILECCRFLLHESPRDFGRLVSEGGRRGLKVINVLDYDASEVIRLLSLPTEDPR